YQRYREAHGELSPPPIRQLDSDLLAIRWQSQPAFTAIPYRQVWDGSWLRAHPDAFSGKAVLIGETVRSTTGDVHVTPVGTLPGDCSGRASSHSAHWLASWPRR